MTHAAISGLYRHPVKGFTPESLSVAELAVGGFFPCDRIYAVEDGPSGFDPSAPAFTPKTKFAVLARTAAIAGIRTRYEDAAGDLHVSIDGDDDEVFPLLTETGRTAFAKWLSGRIGDGFRGPLKVLPAPGDHRFTDHPQGCVSIINTASVAALSHMLGVPVGPLRFRGNILIEGLNAWEEDAWTPGTRLRMGVCELDVFKPITRCKATHADPATGVYDLDVVPALFRHFRRNTLGVYASVSRGGCLAVGDSVSIAES